jgi:hypothetical protein
MITRNMETGRVSASVRSTAGTKIRNDRELGSYSGEDQKNTSRSVKVSHKHLVGTGACARMVGV